MPLLMLEWKSRWKEGQLGSCLVATITQWQLLPFCQWFLFWLILMWWVVIVISIEIIIIFPNFLIFKGSRTNGNDFNPLSNLCKCLQLCGSANWKGIQLHWTMDGRNPISHTAGIVRVWIRSLLNKTEQRMLNYSLFFSAREFLSITSLRLKPTIPCQRLKLNLSSKTFSHWDPIPACTTDL